MLLLMASYSNALRRHSLAQVQQYTTVPLGRVRTPHFEMCNPYFGRLLERTCRHAGFAVKTASVRSPELLGSHCPAGEVVQVAKFQGCIHS